jgi:hypothetical protein
MQLTGKQFAPKPAKGWELHVSGSEEYSGRYRYDNLEYWYSFLERFYEEGADFGTNATWQLKPIIPKIELTSIEDAPIPEYQKGCWLLLHLEENGVKHNKWCDSAFLWDMELNEVTTFREEYTSVKWAVIEIVSLAT